MKLLYSILSITLVTSLYCTTSYAEDAKPETATKNVNELSLEDVLNIPIEVASQKSQTIFNTPSVVSVIDAKMIQDYNFQSVSEALNILSGVKVVRGYLRRNIANIRGILNEQYDNQVLLMINGNAVWNAITGEAELDRININTVERIEVLKGPASVLYGSNAYTGAINLILKKATKESGEANLGVVSTNTIRGGGTYFYADDPWSVTISSHVQAGDGFSQQFTGETTTGLLQEYVNPATFTLNATRGDDNVLFNFYRVVESTLGNTPDFSSGAGYPLYRSGYMGAYTHTFRLGGNGQIKSGVSLDENSFDFARTADNSQHTNSGSQRISGYANADIPLNDKFDVEFGVEAETRQAFNYNVYNPVTQALITDNNMAGQSNGEGSVFAQATWDPKPFNLLVGDRLTYNSSYKLNNSIRSTALYSLGERSSLKLVFGQSFRAPSLFELFFVSPGNTINGNPNLLPETSNSIELAYLTSIDHFFIQSLVYGSQYYNKIYRQKIGKLFFYQNANTFNTIGFELETKYQNPGLFDVILNYDLEWGDQGDLYSQGTLSLYNFKFIPMHTISAGLYKKISKFYGSALFEYWSSTSGTFAPISDQFSLDLNIGYTGDHVTHQISVKNLTNTQFQFAEFSRGTLNQISMGTGRAVTYDLKYSL